MSIAEHMLAIEESIGRVLATLPDHGELSQWIRAYANDHHRRLAEDLRLITESAPLDAAILEFGSSPFFLTDALQRGGYSVIGLDIDPDRFRETIRVNELDIRAVDFEAAPVPFEDETFDIVLFNEVFEHLRIDLIATMREVCRVVKRSGTVWLSTPNHRSLIGLWTLLWHHKGCHVCPDLFYEYEKLRLFGHMGHVREYTAREVSDFLAKIGLRTRRVHFRYYRPRKAPGAAMSLRNGMERAITTILPGLRPMFSLECKRADGVAGHHGC